ncbi:MAG: HAD family hydrolase [Flavobacteriales bacterium]
MHDISNLILDLGGVLFHVDYDRTAEAFVAAGCPDFKSWYSQKQQRPLFDDLETGRINATNFRDAIRSASEKVLTDQQIDHAWNAMLIGFPIESVELVIRLSEQYRLFLLSNTNPIHEIAFRRMFSDTHPTLEFDSLFEKVYLSHHIGMRKPEKEIFDLVMEENGLNADATVFVDDSIQHVEGARRAGLHALWLEKQGETEKLLMDSGLIGQRRS